MASLNRVTLIGNLGADPEVRYTQNREAIATIRIATTETYKDKSSGEKKEITEWHRVVFFGRTAEVVGEYLKMLTGTDIVHVPYKGSAPAVTDLIGGQVQVSVQSLPSSISFIKGGKLKVLGVVNEKRVAALPDAPTIGETIKGFGSTPWYGLLAPAGTPKAIVAQLQAEVAKALASPDAKEKLAQVGCEPFVSSPEQFTALIKDDLPKWARIVKDSGATVD